MEQAQPNDTTPTNVHPAQDDAAGRIAATIEAGAFIPPPTPLQVIDARNRFFSAIAAERARASRARRHAR